MSEVRAVVHAAGRRLLPLLALSAALVLAWLILGTSPAHAGESGHLKAALGKVADRAGDRVDAHPSSKARHTVRGTVRKTPVVSQVKPVGQVADRVDRTVEEVRRTVRDTTVATVEAVRGADPVETVNTVLTDVTTPKPTTPPVVDSEPAGAENSQPSKGKLASKKLQKATKDRPVRSAGPVTSVLSTPTTSSATAATSAAATQTSSAGSSDGQVPALPDGAPGQAPAQQRSAGSPHQNVPEATALHAVRLTAVEAIRVPAQRDRVVLPTSLAHSPDTPPD